MIWMYKWKDELISARLNTAIKSQTISSNTVRATNVASKVFWSQKTPGGDSDESPPFA